MSRRVAFVVVVFLATTGCRRLGLEIGPSRSIRMAKVENASAVLADSYSRYGPKPKTSVTAWNPKTSRPYWSVPVPEIGTDWEVGGERLVIANGTSTLETYELAHGKKANTFDVGAPVRRICRSPDGRSLLVSSAEQPTDADAKRALSFDPVTGKFGNAEAPCPPPLPEMPTATREAKFGEYTYRYDGKRLVATAKDGKELWNQWASDVKDVAADDEVVVVDGTFVEVYDAKTGKSLGGILAQARPTPRSHVF